MPSTSFNKWNLWQLPFLGNHHNFEENQHLVTVNNYEKFPLDWRHLFQQEDFLVIASKQCDIFQLYLG